MNDDPPIRVLIAAPYAAVRAGLHVLIDRLGDVCVAGEVGDIGEIERVLPTIDAVDVLLFDAGPDGAARLAPVLSDDTALVILSDDPDSDARVLRARRRRRALRGWACLRKEADAAQIVAAVRGAASGLVLLEPSTFDALILDSVEAASDDDDAIDADAAPQNDADLAPLTPREREVLQLMAQGLPNKIIATRLGISLHTVKFHVAAILSKLGAASRTEAVTLGARGGLVTL